MNRYVKYLNDLTDPWPCRSGRVSGLLAAGVLAGLVLMMGCTSARQRDDPTNLVGNLAFRDDATFDFFHEVYRSGNLYQDFRPVLVTDAIYEDKEYRKRYVGMHAQRFLLPQEEIQRMAAQQQKEYENRMDFLLLVWGGSNKKVNIHKPDGSWRVFLRDDEGTLVPPDKVERIKNTKPRFEFLRIHFTGLDRWSELVRVSFPKLNKALLKTGPGTQPIKLIVTGMAGTVTMSWADRGLFYRKRASSAPR